MPMTEFAVGLGDGDGRGLGGLRGRLGGLLRGRLGGLLRGFFRRGGGGRTVRGVRRRGRRRRGSGSLRYRTLRPRLERARRLVRARREPRAHGDGLPRDAAARVARAGRETPHRRRRRDDATARESTAARGGEPRADSNRARGATHPSRAPSRASPCSAVDPPPSRVVTSRTNGIGAKMPPASFTFVLLVRIFYDISTGAFALPSPPAAPLVFSNASYDAARRIFSSS